MKMITVRMSDKIFSELRTCMSVRGLIGWQGSVTDAFLDKIIQAVKDGESEVDVKMKG